MRWPLPLLAMLCLLGCAPQPAPATSGGQATSGDPAPAPADEAPPTWVVFDVSEAGSGASLAVVVWPVERPESAEVISSGAKNGARWEGLGRTADGPALVFEPGSTVELMFWAPDHELKRASLRVVPGENLARVELLAAEVPEEQLPDYIRSEILPNLPPAMIRK